MANEASPVHLHQPDVVSVQEKSKQVRSQQLKQNIITVDTTQRMNQAKRLKEKASRVIEAQICGIE